jgi:hypothetical protein
MTTSTPVRRERIPVRLLLADTDAADEPRVSELVIPGWSVAPGLAVHPSWQDGEPVTGRYSLTHLASGSTIAAELCARHVDQAAAVAIATGIDWTVDREAIRDDPRRAGLLPGTTAWDWCGYDEFCRVEPYPRPSE